MPFIESLILVTNERIHQKTFGAKSQRVNHGLTIVGTQTDGLFPIIMGQLWKFAEISEAEQ